MNPLQFNRQHLKVIKLAFPDPWTNVMVLQSFPLLIPLASFLVSSVTGDGPGWVTLCTSAGTRKVHAGSCPRGILTKSPLFVTSACLNGIWILSNGECDQNPVILVGRGNADCFALSIEVLSYAHSSINGEV